MKITEYIIYWTEQNKFGNGPYSSKRSLSINLLRSTTYLGLRRSTMYLGLLPQGWNAMNWKDFATDSHSVSPGTGKSPFFRTSEPIFLHSMSKEPTWKVFMLLGYVDKIMGSISASSCIDVFPMAKFSAFPTHRASGRL